MVWCDPAQVLDVLRDVLVKHMDAPDALPDYQVQSAVFIGKHSGRLMSEDDVISGKDVPGGLRLTMRSGAEYDLTLTAAETNDADDDE
jgi:hypothetical protein